MEVQKEKAYEKQQKKKLERWQQQVAESRWCR